MSFELEEEIQQEAKLAFEFDSLIKEHRKAIDASVASIVEPPRFDSKIESAENRLHELIIRFNHTLSGNTDVKDQIELLRKERDTFSSIHSKMKNEIKGMIVRMSSTAQKTDSDYAARDLAKSQILQLKDQADKEHAEFDREWTELARLIENDKRMREFMEQREMRKKPVEVKTESPVTEKQSDGNEVAEKKAHLAQLQALFETIRLATGMTSMDELITFFVEKEKRNFSMYNKSTESMESAARLELTNKALRSEVHELIGIIEGKQSPSSCYQRQ